MAQEIDKATESTIPNHHHIKKQLAGLTEKQKRDLYLSWQNENVRLHVLMKQYDLTLFSIYTLIRTAQLKDGIPYWQNPKQRVWGATPRKKQDGQKADRRLRAA